MHLASSLRGERVLRAPLSLMVARCGIVCHGRGIAVDLIGCCDKIIKDELKTAGNGKVKFLVISQTRNRGKPEKTVRNGGISRYKFL